MRGCISWYSMETGRHNLQGSSYPKYTLQVGSVSGNIIPREGISWHGQNMWHIIESKAPPHWGSLVKPKYPLYVWILRVFFPGNVCHWTEDTRFSFFSTCFLGTISRRLDGGDWTRNQFDIPIDLKIQIQTQTQKYRLKIQRVFFKPPRWRLQPNQFDIPIDLETSAAGRTRDRL